VTSTSWWAQFTRIFRTPGQREQDRRLDAQAQDRALSPDDVTGEREARRLAGMTAEDRAWEQASLERNRVAEDRQTS
jgi:hypothetical protein